MKKLGLFALVLGLIVAFAMPAFAFTIEGAKGEKMYIGGMMLTDIGYWNRDKDKTGTGDSQTRFMLTVPNHARIRGSVEVGAVGGYWELGNGGNALNAYASGAGVNNYIETRKLYGWYNFGNCQILAGKNDAYFFSLAPAQNLGFNNDLHIAGFGWGSVYDSRLPQVKFTQNISKAFGYSVALVEPAVYTLDSKISYSQIPVIAAKLWMNFGMVTLYPAAIYQSVKWDKMASGYDDSMAAWSVILPVKLAAGPFTGIFQVGYGENLNGLLGLQSAYHAAQRVDGKIKNTTGLYGFIDLAYTAGPVTPHIFFGYDNAKNSDTWKTGNDYNTRTMMGAALHYKVAPNFTLAPEFTMYDYGQTPNTAAKTELGKEWLAGVQFMFVF